MADSRSSWFARIVQLCEILISTVARAKKRETISARTDIAALQREDRATEK
jgi:hypothetical protein